MIACLIGCLIGIGLIDDCFAAYGGLDLICSGGYVGVVFVFTCILVADLFT